MEFKLNKVLTRLRDRRKVFCSEADFQLELAMIIKDEYKDNVDVRVEYPFFLNGRWIHIDILVIVKSDNSWIPIELKYKTKVGKKSIILDDNIEYPLKNQEAKNENSYLYFKDIRRIEDVRNNKNIKFKEGYTILITNADAYLKEPNNNSGYVNFSLYDGRNIKGGKELKWIEKCIDKNNDSRFKPIKLDDDYSIEWDDKNKYFGLENYSDVDGEVFHILINKIESK